MRRQFSQVRAEAFMKQTFEANFFVAIGVTGTEQGLFATGVYGIVKMASCAIFVFFLADTLGRRWSLMWTGFFMGICMFYIGFYIRFDPPSATASTVSGAGYAALVFVYLFAAAFQFGWGPVCWIYVSEIPSARLRALNVSLAAATQWLFNLVVARSTPVMFNTVGSHGFGTYFIYGSFCFTMVLVVALFVKETKGISLERMDELWGVAKLDEVEDLGAVAISARQGSLSEKTAALQSVHVEGRIK